MRIIDFRSDTVTRPTPEMYKAMMEANLGDDEYGDDPTVNYLEALAAKKFGKESAMFTVSGTMSNLVAILTHCNRGDEMIVGDKSHIFLEEGGGASALGGVHIRSLRNDEIGMLDPLEVEDAMSLGDLHHPTTGLIALENTHTYCGGSVLTQSHIGSIAKVAKQHKIPLHIDGARIFNAGVYLETPVSKLVEEVDTVSFCLSKGLSCPIGSILCGTYDFIKRARYWRETVGGGLRQSGVMAAAGIVGIETMVKRLADDHTNAQRLAAGLSVIKGIMIEPDNPKTNQVYFQVISNNPSKLAEKLASKGIKGGTEGKRWRFVTHNEIGPQDVDYALGIVDSVFNKYD